MSDCDDVCEVVIDKLLVLGFPLNLESDDHDDVLEALGQVDFLRREVSDASMESNR